MLDLRSKQPVAEPLTDTVGMVFEAPAVVPLAAPGSKPETETEAPQPEPMPSLMGLSAPAAQANASEFVSKRVRHDRMRVGGRGKSWFVEFAKT
jgi:hypothetical protein